MIIHMMREEPDDDDDERNLHGFANWSLVKICSPVLGSVRSSGLCVYQKANEVDHNDPSKSSHRLTNGPEPSCVYQKANEVISIIK